MIVPVKNILFGLRESVCSRWFNTFMFLSNQLVLRENTHLANNWSKSHARTNLQVGYMLFGGWRETHFSCFALINPSPSGQWFFRYQNRKRKKKSKFTTHLACLFQQRHLTITLSQFYLCRNIMVADFDYVLWVLEPLVHFR